MTDYCIDCIYLPADLVCLVAEEGKKTKTHIINRACKEYRKRDT